MLWGQCKPQKPALFAVLLQRLRALWEWGLYLGLMQRRLSRPDETRLIGMLTPSPDWLTQPLSIDWALCAARAAMISGSCGSPQSASASILRPMSCRIGEIRYSSQYAMLATTIYLAMSASRQPELTPSPMPRIFSFTPSDQENFPPRRWRRCRNGVGMALGAF